MADLSIFKLDSQTITIKDRLARQTADSAKTLATTADGNATTALNKINELESEKADAIISSTSGAIASFQDGAEAPVKSLTVGIEPVQEGTGDPSPDNVRPISGWTGAMVTRTGKNLLDTRNIRNGNFNKYNIPNTLKNGETYTFSVFGDSSIEFVYGLFAAHANEEVPKPNIRISPKYCSVGEYGTFTAPDDIEDWEYLFLGGSARGAGSADVSFQVALGSTATDYEPYAGNTYDITFPSEAGTVYGGTLDVTNGVLTVDRAQIASYAGETLPSTWISDRDVYSAGATPTTGAQVVYELATPVTYQLTPLEVTTLLGQNNICADTGDMSVTYRADTKLYIDKKFTELQARSLRIEKGETNHDSTKENITITTGTHDIA